MSSVLIQFHVPCIPVAQPRQRHRIINGKDRSFVGNYTPKNSPVNGFKAACQQAASLVYQGAPVDGPLVADIVFVMPRPSNKIWKTRSMPRYPHTGKPDRDNLAKAVFDALEGLVYRNDSLIFDGTITKWVASGDEQPHAEVVIREWCENSSNNI